jgi:hypothetical protein
MPSLDGTQNGGIPAASPDELNDIAPTGKAWMVSGRRRSRTQRRRTGAQAPIRCNVIFVQFLNDFRKDKIKPSGNFIVPAI